MLWSFLYGIENNIIIVSKCWVTKYFHIEYTVKLGNKERFDKEQIGIRDFLWITNPFTQ